VTLINVTYFGEGGSMHRCVARVDGFQDGLAQVTTEHFRHRTNEAFATYFPHNRTWLITQWRTP